MNYRLSIHHIGGRDGTQAFPPLDKFKHDIVNVLYDADAECIEQLSQQSQAQYTLPYCFGETCTSTVFHITQNPYLSSLREANPYYQEFYFSSGGLDYLLSDIYQVAEHREVDLITLDHLFFETTTSVPPPDFLSIDAQGAEYDILAGAQQTLQSHILGLVIEVEFHPLYQDQKLFGDIVARLSEQGFDFVKFLTLHDEVSPFRAPIGLRGEGFNMSGDALFLRRPEPLAAMNAQEHWIMLHKLAFIAIVFQQFEFGLKCLKLIRESEKHAAFSSLLDTVSYYQFLREVDAQSAAMPLLYPETTRESQGRFEKTHVANPNVKRIARFRKLLQHIPGILPLFRTSRALFATFSLRVISFEIILHKILSRYTPVERVLLRWGLTAQLNVIMKNRIMHTRLGKLYLSTYHHDPSEHSSS